MESSGMRVAGGQSSPQGPGSSPPEVAGIEDSSLNTLHTCLAVNHVNYCLLKIIYFKENIPEPRKGGWLFRCKEIRAPSWPVLGLEQRTALQVPWGTVPWCPSAGGCTQAWVIWAAHLERKHPNKIAKISKWKHKMSG